MKLFLTLVFHFILVVQIFAQANLWNTQTNSSFENIEPIDIMQYVREANYVTVDFEQLKSELLRAPKEWSRKKGKLVYLPTAQQGESMLFEVFESSVMQKGISKRYPEIRSYKVVAVENPEIKGRIGFGTRGFHGVIRSNSQLVYIDRYSNNNPNYYVVYDTKNYAYQGNNLRRVCGVEEDIPSKEELEEVKNIIETRSPMAGDSPLRQYRLALACTGEWGAKQGTKANALSEMNKAINRVNEITESEVGLRMILIDNNDKVIYLDGETDPYLNPTQGGGLLAQNNFNLNAQIGVNNYDIGHIYTIGCSDVGGIASLQSVCSPIKGQGCTCNYTNNIDYIASQVTSHEMGHQLSATHTFNNCNGNESLGSGFEPGGGATLMAYAGLCGAQLNIVTQGYETYHGFSLQQMREFMTIGGGASCVEEIETENIAPVVSLDYIDGFYIPISTPFMLTGSATDANGDEIYYSWEEMDKGPSSIPGNPIGDAPQFIPELPNKTPERILPRIESLLFNETDKAEVLPFFNKDMEWRLTARDLNSEAGAFDFKQVQFYATETAGPFTVLYPDSPEIFTAGETYTIEWDVANTNGELVNCQNVDILISENLGFEYKMVLKANTPNDGSEEVVMPNYLNKKVRIMVRASENIFFDISNWNSDILATDKPGYYFYPQSAYQDHCLPSTPEVLINTQSFGNYEGNINFTVLSGLPDGASFAFEPATVVAGESTKLTINTDNISASSTDTIYIQAASDQDTFVQTVVMNFISSDFSELQTLAPAYGSSAVIQSPTFEWQKDNDAEYYVLEVSDNPDFVNGTIVYTETLTDTQFKLPIALFKNTIYFWRVTAYNSCGDNYTTDISAFATEALSCKITTFNQLPFYITTSSPATYELEIQLVSNGQVSDVNVRNFSGGHGNFKELEASLISPKGTKALLFKNQCFGATTFNIGFDDNAPTELTCPPIGGKLSKPIDPFSVFNGEEILGVWKLELKDNAAGLGGQVNNYELEVCSNASLSEPVLVNNKLFKAIPAKNNSLFSYYLKVEDENNSADEITYKLVSVPEKGTLRLNGEDLVIGSTFTQEQINDYKLFYLHDGVSTAPDTDSFLFVADDSEGGWIPITQFDINIDIKNSVKDLIDDQSLQLYPNPTNQFLTVYWDQKGSTLYDIEIIDLAGRTLLSKNIVNGAQLDVNNLPSGSYFLKAKSAQSYQVKEFQIVR